MTHVSLLVVGTPTEKLAEALDPFLKNPVDKRLAHFTVLEGEMREEYETCAIRSNRPGAEDDVIPVKEHYSGDFDAFAAAHYPWAEKNADGVWGTWNNPNGKYSYYVIGGRNTGFFQMCEGGVGRREPSRSRFDPIPEPNCADITQLKYWDQALQSKRTADRAVERHRYFYAKLGDIRLPVGKEDWPKFFQEDSPLHGYDLESIYTQTEAEYAKLAALRANVSYAVLKDGVIYERQYEGRAGAAGEVEEFYQWYDTFMGLFEGLDPDTPLIALTAYE